jgi:drug/metabolite transporter (DMT)-like permease
MKRDPLALAAVLVLATIWGYNWVVIKLATQGADAVTVAALRSLIGAICLFVALAVTGRSLRPPPALPTAILGLTQTTLYMIVSVLAVATGGAGKTAILNYTMPFWIALMSWPLLHERISRTAWLALAFAAVGLGLVLMPLDGNGLLSKALAVGGAIIWAATSVYGKLLRANYHTDLLALTSWQMLYGALPLTMLAALEPAHRLEVTWSFVAAIAYAAIPGTAFAWLLWMFILSRLPAGVAGISSLLTPVIGVGAAWLELGERPGPLEIAGIGCIVVALIVNLLPAQANVGRPLRVP